MKIMNHIKNLKKRVRRWIDNFLEGHYDHYSCNLPQRLDTFSRFIVRPIFSEVSVNASQIDRIRALKDTGIIVYVSKYTSTLEYLFYHIRYDQEGLPSPEIALDHKIFLWQPVSRIFRIILAHIDHLIKYKTFPNPYKSGFIQRSLKEEGKSAHLSLVNRRGFYKRFVKAKTDPVAYLIDLQKKIDKPIYIVPQWLLFSKKPQRSQKSLVDILFGGEENPGRLRRLWVLLHTPNKVFVEISNPINLKYYLERSENQGRNIEHLSFDLRQGLIDQLNRHRQSITGPVLKSQDELKELVLRNERFYNFLVEYAQSHDRDINDIRRKADRYLNEIAADYDITVIQILAFLFGWVWKTMFDGITLDMEGLDRVKNAAQKAPLVLVPCHKSHFDYLILSYLLFINNMPCPHVAAGRNLSFWPLGPIFRKGGAFFIRRSFQGAKLYAEVFSEYIRMLLEQGFNIEFFIEGGRSRTGKLVPPKTGLLSILIKAYENGACRDLIFVPTFIGYDRVLEETSFMKELEGEKKEPENLSQLIRLRKFMKKRYGHVYVQFEKPISLTEFLSKYNTPLKDMGRRERQGFYQNLAYRIVNGINRVSVVTPHAVVASAILNYPRLVFTQNDIMQYVEAYLDYLVSQKVRLSENFEDRRRAVYNVLNLYNQRRFIERLNEKKGRISYDNQKFAIVEYRRPNLEYYKNNCIHFFVPPAYTAMSILSYDSFQFSVSDLYSDYHFLQNLFKYEFVYDMDKTPEYFVEITLKSFVDDSILIPRPSLSGVYNITSSGFKKLFFFASFLKTYFESYWVVLSVLKRYPRRNLRRKEAVKKIQAMGNRLYKRREIDRKESLSQANYNNAITYFNEEGIKGREDEKGIRFYMDVIQKYLGCFTFYR